MVKWDFYFVVLNKLLATQINDFNQNILLNISINILYNKKLQNKPILE